MGGGYVSCGAFSGDDKSCSAFQGVLEQIVGLPSYSPDAALKAYVDRMRAFFSGEGDWQFRNYILIPPERAIQLEPYLEECKRSLIADLNTEDPFEAIEKDDAVPGLDPGEAKWGKGKGWRLYCLRDLLLAIAHSRRTNTDICVSFD